MDRNDKNYFKRPTPEILESRFDGHVVPEYIKTRAKLIMRRFTINGECDGMYISNCIAFENGTGDGHGSFGEGEIAEDKVGKIVSFLMNAYKCNIYPCDREDLTEIIRTGTLPKEKMLSGLKNAARIRREHIRRIRNTKKDYSEYTARILNRFSNPCELLKQTKKADNESDLWRIEFLYGEINVIKDTILAETA